MSGQAKDSNESNRGWVEEAIDAAMEWYANGGIPYDPSRERWDFVKRAFASQYEDEQRAEGFYQLGRRDVTLTDTKALMESEGWNVEEAMETLDIPDDERRVVASGIERGREQDLRKPLLRKARESMADAAPEDFILNKTDEEVYWEHYREGWTDATLLHMGSLANNRAWVLGKAMDALGIADEEGRDQLLRIFHQEQEDRKKRINDLAFRPPLTWAPFGREADMADSTRGGGGSGLQEARTAPFPHHSRQDRPLPAGAHVSGGLKARYFITLGTG